MKDLLIVDDERALREGLAGYLRKIVSPFDNIYTAASGQAALQCLEEKNIAAALVDINLGDMNGLDLIEIMKSRSPHTILVIISGYDDFDFARRAIKLGVYDYLLKPIPKTDLQHLLQNLATAWQQPAPPPIPENNLVETVIRYLENHYSEKNLTLTQVAQRFFVSETYLSKQMKQTLGASFSEYLINFRLQKAQELLQDAQLRYTIAEIAFKVGYEDAHYFSRLFKKKLTCSPKEYRQRHL